MRECQECGRWGETQSHHKIPKGRDKRGWDFPGNLIDLCWDCHHGGNGPHRNRARAVRYFREVRDYLNRTLTQPYYTPDKLSAAIKLPIKQAHRVVRLLKPGEHGYRREDIIWRLCGNKYDWADKNAG